jgi:5-formyltetrahydrofolate cyclo-ligase
MLNKSEWRKKIKQLLVSMEEEKRLHKSKEVSLHLMQTPQWKNSTCVGITVSRGFELNTKPIIEAAWKEGKIVCVPKCYSTDKSMEFREMISFDDLENVYMDLYEPKTDKTKIVPAEQIDLLIVPGLVFDKEGYRIGYGGGYYDRYLQNYEGDTVSLAFTLQLGEGLPHEEFDIPVQHIITENGLLK